MALAYISRPNLTLGDIMGYRFAIIGATGNVGTEMLEILAESDIEVDEVFAVASRKSVGRVVSFG